MPAWADFSLFFGFIKKCVDNEPPFGFVKLKLTTRKINNNPGTANLFEIAVKRIQSTKEIL